MDVTCQAPLSMEFCRKEFWSQLPFPAPGDLPDRGVKPRPPVSCNWQVGSSPAALPGKPMLQTITQSDSILSYITLHIVHTNIQSHRVTGFVTQHTLPHNHITCKNFNPSAPLTHCHPFYIKYKLPILEFHMLGCFWLQDINPDLTCFKRQGY